MLVVALATSHNVATDTTNPAGLQADRTPTVEAGGTNTAIVCDTMTYLPPEILRQLGIREVSLYVSLAGEQRAEAEIEDYDEFYDRLRASEEGVTTSQPSVGDFVATYE